MKKIVALVLSLVMVLGLATTAFGVDAVLYGWSDDAEDWVDAQFDITGDIDDQAQDYDDGVLPCYVMETNGTDYYFVETTEATAEYKLVYGAKTVYLEVVDKADIAFVAKASAFTVVDEDDAVCGDYYVADLDEDAVYYASYKKNGTVDEVYVADKTSDDNVLVNGKLVAAKEATAVTSMTHDWVGYDVVDYAYTTVKCQNCGKVADLYANATAAGKGAEQVKVGGTVLGYITKAAAGYAASAPAAGDKVESAETFDAGIAMYVGMSVMAAAGSAVVLKKKD